jgi:hypothetical protein
MRHFYCQSDTQSHRVLTLDSDRTLFHGSWILTVLELQMKSLILYAEMQMPSWRQEGRAVAHGTQHDRVRVWARVTRTRVISIAIEVFDGYGWVNPLDHLNL